MFNGIKDFLVSNVGGRVLRDVIHVAAGALAAHQMLPAAQATSWEEMTATIALAGMGQFITWLRAKHETVKIENAKEAGAAQRSAGVR